jgi:thiol-disulfide isomerase/thioredoxin
MTSSYRPFALILLTLIALAGCEQQAGRPQLSGEGLKQLPEFSFVDLEGQPRNSSEWAGKAIILNFWATWCPPCRKEMPLFVDAQREYGEQGVQVIGIAVDDPHMVQDFVDVYGIDFPILIGDTEAIKLANRLGNRFDALPFTAIFDKNGNTTFIQAGQIDAKTLQQAISGLF